MTARRWRWIGITTGLLIGAIIATVLWVQRPDPTLDELMQADVLSQMAIGDRRAVSSQRTAADRS